MTDYVTFYSKTDIGHRRTVNEDNLWPPEALDTHPYPEEGRYGQLFLVADGMGGHGAGDIASSLAVQAISGSFYDESNPEAGIGVRLEQSIQAAHRAIHQASATATTERMGTTVVAAVIKDDQLWVAWVGDSRAYRLRDENLELLTEDHSELWEQVRDNRISWEELHYHPRRSKLTNSLTARRPTITVGQKNLPLQPGDQILLCSDGLTSEVRNRDIQAILTSRPPKEAVDVLIKEANTRKTWLKDGEKVVSPGGEDNITTILVQMPGGKTRYGLAPAKIAAIGVAAAVVLAAAGGAFFLTRPTPTPAETAVLVADQTLTPTKEGQSGGVWGELDATATPTATAAVATEEAEESPTPTLAPGETPKPTSTLAAFATPTLVPPTATPAPQAGTSSAVAAAPTATGAVNDGPEIDLIEPEDGANLTINNVEFKWQYGKGCQSPPPGTGFEVRIWPDNPGAQPEGAMDAEENQKGIICDPATGIRSYTVGNVKAAPGVGRADAGAFRWDVAIVQLDQYRVLASAPAHAFAFPGPGGGGGEEGGFK